MIMKGSGAFFILRVFVDLKSIIEGHVDFVCNSKAGLSVQFSSDMLLQISRNIFQ